MKREDRSRSCDKEEAASKVCATSFVGKVIVFSACLRHFFAAVFADSTPVLTQAPQVGGLRTLVTQDVTANKGAVRD